MSLGDIFICCDNGEFFATEFVQGDRWALSLTDHDYDSHQFWLRCDVGSQSRLPLEEVVQIAQSAGVPIKRVLRSGLREWQKWQWRVFSIVEWTGEPFPRRLLPADWQPKQHRNLGEGLYVCFTEAHRQYRDRGRRHDR